MLDLFLDSKAKIKSIKKNFQDVFSKVTIIFGLLVALLVNAIGSIANSILPLVNNTGCLDPLRCTELYLYVMYSIILVLGVSSFIFLVVLILIVQYRVKWEERCDELDDY
jgi:hypothetical protein